MDADKYFDHWQGKRVWTHLKWPKHQKRFRTISGYLEGHHLADVGCATGHSTKELEALHPGHWEGIDFSVRPIQAACKFFPEGTWLYSPDFQLAERFGTYDSVVCSEVLEHVERDQDLAKALLDITRRVLVVTTPCIRVSDPGHLRIYSEKSLNSLFTSEAETLILRTETFFYLIARPR